MAASQGKASRKVGSSVFLIILIFALTAPEAEARIFGRFFRGRNAGFVPRPRFAARRAQPQFVNSRRFNNFGRFNDDLILPTFLQGEGANFPIGLTPLTDRLVADFSGRVFELDQGIVRQEIIRGRNGGFIAGSRFAVDPNTFAQLQAINSANFDGALSPFTNLNNRFGSTRLAAPVIRVRFR